MPKHDYKHHSKKKESSSKTTLIAITLIMVILVISGIFFLKPYLEKQKYGTYNYFEFEQNGDYWVTNVQYDGYINPITFYQHPVDLEGIVYDEKITPYILEIPHRSFTIAMRDDVGSVPVIAGVNIARILGERFYGFEVNSALYSENNELNTTLPTVSCDDATEIDPVIFLNIESGITSVVFSKENPNCIVINTKTNEKDEVLGVADLMVYKILEIM